jgi:FK506-binding protein 4/5
VISYFVSSIPLGRKGRNMSNGVHSIPPSSLLNIDVELVSFKPVIDIIGDSKVFKKILKEGDQGAVAAIEGATVTSK